MAAPQPACEVSGSGGLPPLGLIHGVGTNRTIWSRVRPLLDVERTVAAVDLPGFGESPEPAGGWDLGEVADAVGAVLADRLDPPFDLVGSSLGGAVALVVARRHPELIKRLVLCAPAGFRPLGGPLPALAGHAAGPLLTARRLAGGRLADNRHARRVLLSGTVADGAALSPEDARLMLAASEGAVALRSALTAAARADLRREAAELAAAPGVIWGSFDRVIPPHTAERILEIHPDAPIELIAGAGHIPHLERPKQFAEALERLHSRLP